jgi:hypothetical protein
VIAALMSAAGKEESKQSKISGVSAPLHRNESMNSGLSDCFFHWQTTH